MFILFGINMGAQALFLYIIANTDLTVSDYTDDMVQELRDWRRNTAHHIDNYDPITGKSLSYRVCAGDFGTQMSTQQADLVETLQNYMGDPPKSVNSSLGSMLCLLGLMSWYLTLGKEMNSTFNTVRAAFTLPWRDSTLILQNNDAVEDLFYKFLQLRCAPSAGSVRVWRARVACEGGAHGERPRTARP